MAKLDASKLTLKDLPNDLQYDPHLRDAKLRAAAGKDPVAPIGSVIKEKRYVDVIAKLKKPGEVPRLAVTGSREGRIVTGRVAIEDIEKVRRMVTSLKAATGLHLCLFNSVPAIKSDRKSTDSILDSASFKAQDKKRNRGLDGSGVIIGVVDIGCDFRHPNFRKEEDDSTRLLFLWDQSASPDVPPGHKVPFDYGREFTADEINAALRNETRKESAYKLLGYSPPIAAHGTHVLDIAAGNGRAKALFGGREGDTPAGKSAPGVAPSADLIFVHLKTLAGGGLANSNYLTEAVEYIFDKARELGRPAIVNLSLSTTGGPHDGTTVVEQKFEELLREPGRAIVVAAGNSFNQQGHLNRVVAGKGQETILWHTDPRNVDPDTTKNEMEVWYPGNRELQVTLFTPAGAKLGSVALRKTKVLYDAGGNMCGRIDHRADDPNNGDNQIDIQLPHLEGVGGAWRIELSNVGDEEVPFHAWIEQDDSGRSRFAGPTDPSFTLGSISCSRKTLTVGAFDTSEAASLTLPFSATSAGPTRPSHSGTIKPQDKPELSAPGVGIVAARAHGGVTVMDGTSMAAAHVTGVVALLFDLAQRRGDDPLPTDLTREILIGAARKESPQPLLPQDLLRERRLGVGSIDGAEAVRAMLEREVYHQEEPGLQPNGPGLAPKLQGPDLEKRLEEMLARQLEVMEKKMSRKLNTIARMIPKSVRPVSLPPRLQNVQKKAEVSAGRYGPNGQESDPRDPRKAHGSGARN